VWTAYGTRLPADVLVLELGVRRPGDMRAHLELLHPDIAVLTPLTPTFSHDGDALAVLRREMLDLCGAVPSAGLLLCTDDPSLAELADRTPGAIRFGSADVVDAGGGTALHLPGTAWAIGRDVVGASHLRALSVAARVGRLLGVSDSDIGAYLAGTRGGAPSLHP
jgi:UDP-N-acetylmuramyl pentapeptide synthase